MYIKGDIRDQVLGYIDNGWVTGYDGAGSVAMEIVNFAGTPQAGAGDYTKIYGVIPEPGTMLLAGLGVLVLLLRRRKR